MIPSLNLDDGQVAFLNVLGIIATVLAVIVAVITIWQAKRQARASAEALIRERRIDFELGVLQAIGDLLFRDAALFGEMKGHMAMLLAMLPEEDLPLIRGGTYPSEQRRELAAAIRARVDARA